MSRRKTSRRSEKALESLAGQIGEDDGVDPRYSFQAPSRSGHGRKAMQLCKQVSRALLYALSECDDDVLRELFVESVVPAPDQNRLMVTVTPLGSELDQVKVLTRLGFVTPFLRNEVAQSINRKKVPELFFRFVPRSALVSPPEGAIPDDTAPDDENTGEEE